MNTVEEIKELLQKNKKRLDKELQQSKEAVSLIKKSMHSSLSEEEKEKVKIVRKFNLHGSVWQKWKQDDDRIRK